jgi:hypothetical protein
MTSADPDNEYNDNATAPDSIPADGVTTAPDNQYNDVATATEPGDSTPATD